LAFQEGAMLDDFIDRLISRLMTGAGLIMAAAIAAVATAMAVFAFLSQWVGAAWAYAIVAATAALVVTVWALLQKQHIARTRQPPLDERVLTMMQAHPTASFMAGMAAATLLKGKPSLAASLWDARKGKPK
jgi:low affinity Fe/Cu permease